jgi:hypothetical protein
MFSKKPKLILICFLVIVLGGSLVGVGAWYMRSSQNSAFKDSVLVENLLISTEWQEIEAKDLIKIKGDRQFLSIVIDEPFEGDLRKPGIRTPEGEIFNPEIRLIDKEGNKYELVYDGSLGNMRINYASKDGLPEDRVFDKIMIRSKVPIKAKKVIWTFYNAKDLK